MYFLVRQRQNQDQSQHLEKKISSTKSTKMSKFRSSNRSKQNVKHEMKVPWAPGFKPPSERDRFRAIGLGDRMNECKDFKPGIHFDTIVEPVSDKDWLANQKEDGQSYFQFIGTCPWLQRGKVKGYEDKHNAAETDVKNKYPNGKIYLLELLSEQNTDKEIPVIDTECLREYVEIYYGITTVLLPALHLKRDANGSFIISSSDVTRGNNSSESAEEKAGVQRKEITIYPTYRQNDDGSKYQLRIDTGLSDLKMLMPKDGLFLVGITMMDLYCDKTDLFTVGIGSCKDRLGIFSFLRYDPLFKQLSEENWFEYEIESTDINSEERTKLILQRSLKTMVHEVGHLFGIKHCIYFMCSMNGSGHLDEDFRQPINVCPVDLHKLCSLSGIEIRKRYEKLLSFYRMKNLNVESSWMTSRLLWLN